MAELEEKIRELKEQREAHIAERNKLEGERKDCHERGKQVDDEVEAITVEMEELRVCRLLQFYGFKVPGQTLGGIPPGLGLVVRVDNLLNFCYIVLYISILFLLL